MLVFLPKQLIQVQCSLILADMSTSSCQSKNWLFNILWIRPKKNPAKRTKNAAHAQKQRYVYGVKKKYKRPSRKQLQNRPYRVNNEHSYALKYVYESYTMYIGNCRWYPQPVIENVNFGFFIFTQQSAFHCSHATDDFVIAQLLKAKLELWSSQSSSSQTDPIRSVGAPSCSDGCMWEWVEWLMYGYIMFGLRISSAEQRKLSLFLMSPLRRCCNCRLQIADHSMDWKSFLVNQPKAIFNDLKSVLYFLKRFNQNSSKLSL